MTHVRIATRRSHLALTQARMVAEMLASAHPDVTTELVRIETTGDIDRTSPMAALSEVGAFVRAVQQAVLGGRADVAVHSCKDLPVAGPMELDVAYPDRASPWDVLCGATLAELPGGSRVGTGSPRRRSQLLRMRPDLVVDEIRGNVGTRLGKVASGEYDAVVLAEAGLERSGMTTVISQRFRLEEMVPAPAQAALAVEFVAGSDTAELVAAIDDPATRRTVEAERRLLAETGAGCRSALGALASIEGDRLIMTGFVDDAAGPRRAQVSGEDTDDVVAALRAELAL